MARFFFIDSKQRDAFFNNLKNRSDNSWYEIAQKLGISTRQLCDCRKGKASLSSTTAEKLKTLFACQLPRDIQIKEDYWHIHEAARLGGEKRFLLHGSPGTVEGRKKGGYNSIKTHKRLKTNFKLRNKILFPRLTSKFAELIGVLMGDGTISKWQARVYLNIHTDKAYASYVKKLFEELFHVKVSIHERKSKSTIEVTASSATLVEFFHRNGLIIGDKLKQGLDIPQWIYTRPEWQKACLRGQFDTDGCTYIDKHFYKNRQYNNIGLAFASNSPLLITSIQKVLKENGYNPTVTTKNRVLLRRHEEIVKFFKDVCPANIRHHTIFNKYLEEYRSGRNGTVSKAVFAVR